MTLKPENFFIVPPYCFFFLPLQRFFTIQSHPITYYLLPITYNEVSPPRHITIAAQKRFGVVGQKPIHQTLPPVVVDVISRQVG